jgi:hypothetical protein
MNAVFYWCGCRLDFEGDVPPPYCNQHKDSIDRIQMEPVVEEPVEEEIDPEEPSSEATKKE